MQQEIYRALIAAKDSAISAKDSAIAAKDETIRVMASFIGRV
jgi:hypothetical protein